MNHLNKKLLSAIITGVVAGGMLAGATTFIKISIHGKYLPNTVLAGIDFSYKTEGEAKNILKSKIEDYYQNSIEFKLKDQNINLLIKDLGIEILWEDSIDVLEKTDSSKINLLNLFNINKQKREELGLLVNIDSNKLVSTIEKAFNLEELKPQSASFYFEKSKLSIKDQKNGVVLVKEDLIKDVKKTIKSLKSNVINIKTKEKKANLSKVDLEAQKEEIVGKLAKKITLIDPIYVDNWHISLEDNLDWVEFAQEQTIELPYLKKIKLNKPIESIEGDRSIVIKVKDDKWNLYVDEKISKWLDRKKENISIKYDEDGEILIEGTGVNGREIKRKLFKEAFELAVNNNIDEVLIPVADIESELFISEDLKRIGIKERISQGYTSYYGSPRNRVHNIKTGALKFNGLIIQPDEKFSFNTNLGAVNGSTGYKKELVIKPEGTIPEFGGGICQVSTTMYRAVLYGGLPINSRRQHSYAVSYYSQVGGHGLDATIYIGGQDLIFTNNTGYPILVQTYIINDYELYINFYGTSDGRTVELEGPNIYGHTNPGPTQYITTKKLNAGESKNVGNAHGGFTADWQYTITDAEGNSNTETLHTVYKSVPKKVWVGEDTVLEESVQD